MARSRKFDPHYVDAAKVQKLIYQAAAARDMLDALEEAEPTIAAMPPATMPQAREILETVRTAIAAAKAAGIGEQP